MTNLSKQGFLYQNFRFTKWKKRKIRDLKKKKIYTKIQCCGAGAGGAEIIWGLGAGAENKFK